MIYSTLGKAILFLCFTGFFSSCTVKKGCPASGSNIGAERILSGDPKAEQAIKKGKKFKV